MHECTSIDVERMGDIQNDQDQTVNSVFEAFILCILMVVTSVVIVVDVVILTKVILISSMAIGTTSGW